MTVACEWCFEEFEPRRKGQRFHNVACRNAWIAWSSAEKRGDAQRGRNTTGTGRYPKHLGRYAHREAAEVFLGRPLRPGETVHHCNGNDYDWSPYNVIVMPSPGAHARLEKQGRDKARKRGQRVTPAERKKTDA